MTIATISKPLRRAHLCNPCDKADEMFYLPSMVRSVPKAFWRAGKHTVITHDGIEHAGYLSFMGLLSLFPFLVFIVALAGFLGEGELGREFILLLRSILPENAMAALLPRIDEIVQGPPRGLLTISMLAAIWTASSVVEGYRTILNRAYHVGTPPAYIWRRLWSIGQLLIFTVLIFIGMMVMLMAPSALEWTRSLIGLELYPNLGFNLQFFSGLILLCVICLAYYSIPNIRQSLFGVLPGALLTLILWVLVTKGLRVYLESFEQMSLIYGSLAGIIAALIFFYLINLIFIFGAELNYQLLLASGRRVEEKEETMEGVEPPKEEDTQPE